MANYSLEQNRVSAFIFIEEKFFSHKYHTECVTEFLKSKKLINTDEELYKMLKNNQKEHIARKWIEQIENNCIFGEIATIKGETSIVVFDKLTSYGLEAIKKEGLKQFGVNKIVFARYIGLPNNKFEFIEI